LKNQLQIQASSLTGHIDEFWPDLSQNSGWLGGTGESWERAPYYLDGLIPLAFLLEDRRLISKVQKWVHGILDRQHENGWLGPIQDPHEPYHPPFDLWPQAILLKALTQYYEATGEDRVINAIQRVYRFIDQHLDEHPLSTWIEYRWGELILSLLWLYKRYPNNKLSNLAARIQHQGFNWSSFFTQFPFRTKIEKGEEGYDFRTHGVNIAMGLKAPGLWHLFSHAEGGKIAVHNALKNLDQYHGQVTGIYSSDGHLAGLNPWQGTELCTVVEMMYSLEVLISLFGDTQFADRLEKIAFNALPAAFSPDMWSHQYDQQVNQVLCTIDPRDWTTNWDDSNIFGLEPSFGCCTANMHQGWPKFTQSIWMQSPDQGIALIVYVPSEVSFTTQRGQNVKIIETTEYPFHGNVQFQIQAEETITFPLHFRIPPWCHEARLSTENDEFLFHKPGRFFTIRREWRPGERFELNFQMPIEIIDAPTGGISISRGPLIFSLKIEEQWNPLDSSPPLAERGWEDRIGADWVRDHAALPHGYYEVLPASPWNFGLMVDRESLQDSIRCIEKPLGDRPFSPDGAPVELKVEGCKIPDWGLRNHSAGPIPNRAYQSEEPIEALTFIPYGCTNLRVTVFPEVQTE
jgi:hypothetical protein